MTQFALLIYGADSAHGADGDPAERAQHDAYAKDLADSGAMVAAFALDAAATARSVRGEVVTDGPFAETKEVFAGLCVIDAPDLEAALAIAARNPVVRMGGGVEVRPISGSFVRP